MAKKTKTRKAKPARTRKVGVFRPNPTSIYSVRAFRKRGVLAIILIPSEPWRPFFSCEVHEAPDGIPNEIRFYLLPKDPFDVKKPNLYFFRDRMEMLKKDRKTVSALCEKALPFLNLQADYTSRPVVQLLKDEKKDLKIAWNGFSENSPMHPSSTEFGIITDTISFFIDSQIARKLKIPRSYGDTISEISHMVIFHSAIKELGFNEPKIEVQTPN